MIPDFKSKCINNRTTYLTIYAFGSWNKKRIDEFFPDFSVASWLSLEEVAKVVTKCPKGMLFLSPEEGKFFGYYFLNIIFYF